MYHKKCLPQFSEGKAMHSAEHWDFLGLIQIANWLPEDWNGRGILASISVKSIVKTNKMKSVEGIYCGLGVKECDNVIKACGYLGKHSSYLQN